MPFYVFYLSRVTDIPTPFTKLNTAKTVRNCSKRNSFLGFLNEMSVKNVVMTSDIESNHLAVTGTKAAINTNCFSVLLKILKVLNELDQSQFNCPFSRFHCFIWYTL